MHQISLKANPVIYTYKEQTEKQHTVQKAIDSAISVLTIKYDYPIIRLDILKKRNKDELLTMVELDKLIQDLVNDTLYWAGAYTNTGPLV